MVFKLGVSKSHYWLEIYFASMCSTHPYHPFFLCVKARASAMPINVGQKPAQNATSLGFDPNGHTHPHRLTESWILTSKVVDQPIELSSQLCCCTILAPPSNLERHLYFFFFSNCSDIIFEQAPMTHVGLLLPLLEMNKSLTWSGLKVSSPRRNPAVNLFASDLRTLSTV